MKKADERTGQKGQAKGGSSAALEGLNEWRNWAYVSHYF
jgi:hypothetical protein